MIHSPNSGMIKKYRDSSYGELSAGDCLTIHPPHSTGLAEKLPSFTFKLVGFNPTRPEIARAEVTVDGKKRDRLQRIDFEALSNWMVDRTAALTGDWRYGAVPIYLNRIGSDHTEVV